MTSFFKFAILCYLLLLVPTFVRGAEPSEMENTYQMEEAEKTKKGAKSYLEAKGGYFFFTSSKIRKIHDEGGLDVQLSG